MPIFRQTHVPTQADVVVTIETDNAAFRAAGNEATEADHRDAREREIERIRSVAYKAASFHNREGVCRDYNGNTVGSWELR